MVGRERGGRLSPVNPIVTLTTDFGLRDAYVAEMKGSLLGHGPSDLRLVDLTHELEPFDVRGAALFLRRACPAFPPGTVHLVVVDPGVGGPRRPIIAKIGDQLWVGPDNKVFGYLFDGREEVFEIDPSRLGSQNISQTFHGRDVFAPVAAGLAQGRPPEDFGARVDHYEHLVFPMIEYSGDTLVGRVIHVDHYGNLITNIAREQLASFCEERDLAFVRVAVRDSVIDGLAGHYAAAEPGELLALIGSSDLLEVAVREGDAAKKTQAERGELVRVRVRPRG